MVILHFNVLAVVVCVIFSCVSGSIWYGPRTLFWPWWQALGRTKEDRPHGGASTWILIVVAPIVQVIAMAWLVPLLAPAVGGESATSGLLIGLVVWGGLVAPSALVNKLFPGQIKAWVIEQGHHLLNYVVFGAILGGWH
ncbi:MAG: DUF1761 domain-containing protein [Gammaproteobacteria bacterium]|nr:DUF1761 domain-containing protein [Gammaproteobacteria bacterium]